MQPGDGGSIDSANEALTSRPAAGPATLQRVERLVDHAAGAFGSRLEAARWFRTPAMGLAQRRPIDLLWTEDGIERIEVLLDRIDHGVYT